MLRRVCEHQDALAAIGASLAPDPFLFSLALDASRPMPPDYLTRRVAALKVHLGIEQKRPETLAREDEALRLFRQAPAPRPSSRTGPLPCGGLSFREIGARLGRSERWAALAVAAAREREAAVARGQRFHFDGSVLALRKFTSSELLDAGFNISMVVQRQGHASSSSASTMRKVVAPPIGEQPIISAKSSTAGAHDITPSGYEPRAPCPVVSTRAA